MLYEVITGVDELEIEVQATGVNFRDVMYTLGLVSDEAIHGGFAGAALGLEFAGVVQAPLHDVLLRCQAELALEQAVTVALAEVQRRGQRPVIGRRLEVAVDIGVQDAAIEPLVQCPGPLAGVASAHLRHQHRQQLATPGGIVGAPAMGQALRRELQ